MTTTYHRKFIERIATAVAAVRVDREAGMIRGAKLVGFESRNGRRYPREVLKKAIAKYEGTLLCIDHPKTSESNEDRPFNTFVGEVRNVRIMSDGLYGDLILRKEHPQFNEICEAAERFSTKFGLSHEVIADSHTEGEWEVIDDIQCVDCIAVVLRPGTTNGLFESGGIYNKSTYSDIVPGADDPRKLIDAQTDGFIVRALAAITLAYHDRKPESLPELVAELHVLVNEYRRFVPDAPSELSTVVNNLEACLLDTQATGVVGAAEEFLTRLGELITPNDPIEVPTPKPTDLPEQEQEWADRDWGDAPDFSDYEQRFGEAVKRAREAKRRRR